ncbi:MAG: GFA family protein [Myxococcota bacterium]
MLIPPFEGGCSCGSVRYRCDAPPFVTYTCHCRDCQRATGSAFATCCQVPAEALHATGEPASHERVADSGNRITTRFCARCGSALWIANAARPRLRTLYIGTLDHPERADVDAHIWTKRRLPWVALPDHHRIFPEAGDWRPDYAAGPSRLEGA